MSRKKGQIAHLDHNSSNNSADNLSYLCLDHHDEYDSHASQAKGLREKEVKFYRESLYQAIRQYMRPIVSSAAESGEHYEEEDALLAKGELEFYLAQFKNYEREGVSVLKEVAGVIGQHNEAMQRSSLLANALLAAPAGKKDFNGYYKVLARDLLKFSDDLDSGTRRFGIVTSKMLDALSRASVVASDYESATVEMFEQKIEDLRSLKRLLEESLRVAGATRDEFKGWSRGPTEYNRGKRLAIATINKYLEEVRGKIDEAQAQEEKLREVMEFL
ncbi:MAG TPA: hypothetical protein VIE43_22045 [Thermoanaerobaculia bacterium]|nr:hypothetical protein [Thermoanaerobaculia bacterium]